MSDWSVKGAIRFLIGALGEDPDREGLIDTPNRVERSYRELYSGYDADPAKVMKSFRDGTCDEMVVLRNIEFYSMCEHHMLPFFGTATIGYLPADRIIGVSKLARVLDIFSRRLQVQERIGTQVVDCLMEHLAPRGAGCVIRARHLCMCARGVRKANPLMITSALRGLFRDKPDVKAEFLSWSKK